MLFKVQAEQLRFVLAKLLTVIDREKQSTRPILGHIYFKAYDNLLELQASDIEVSAKIILEANVENSGEFCVNAKNIFEIIKELPHEEITVSLTQSTLDISCSDIFYSLVVNNPEEYPRLMFENLENQFELSAHDIFEIINRTSYAISTDETRLFLNGIFLQDIDSKLRAVATDGARLALIERELPTDKSEKIDALVNGVIIPKKGIYELKKIAETYPQEMIKISVDDSFMFINAKNTYFLAIRLIAREYPKYQAVIPGKITFSLTVDRDAFLDAVKRIKIMSNEKSNGVRIALGHNEMILNANHPSLGHATEKIPIDYSGKPMDIGFNAKYLIDTFGSLNTGDAIIEFNNEFSAVIIKSSSLPDFLCIVMPLKL